MTASEKIRVGVMFGGRSGEHEVSLVSARSIIGALDKERFDVIPIGITKQGAWMVGADPETMLPAPRVNPAISAGQPRKPTGTPGLSHGHGQGHVQKNVP